MVEVRSEDRVPARRRLGPPGADQDPRRGGQRVDEVRLRRSRFATRPLLVERDDRTFAIAAVTNVDVDPGQRARGVDDVRLASSAPYAELVSAPEEQFLASPRERRRAHIRDMCDLALRRNVEHDELGCPGVVLRARRAEGDARTAAGKPRIRPCRQVGGLPMSCRTAVQLNIGSSAGTWSSTRQTCVSTSPSGWCSGGCVTPAMAATSGISTAATLTT